MVWGFNRAALAGQSLKRMVESLIDIARHTGLATQSVEIKRHAFARSVVGLRFRPRFAACVEHRSWRCDQIVLLVPPRASVQKPIAGHESLTSEIKPRVPIVAWRSPDDQRGASLVQTRLAHLADVGNETFTGKVAERSRRGTYTYSLTPKPVRATDTVLNTSLSGKRPTGSRCRRVGWFTTRTVSSTTTDRRISKSCRGISTTTGMTNMIGALWSWKPKLIGSGSS